MKTKKEIRNISKKIMELAIRPYMFSKKEETNSLDLENSICEVLEISLENETKKRR